MRLSTLLLASAISLAPMLAGAQQPHNHVHGQKLGSYEGELVYKGSEITLLVVDSAEQKVDASKMSATAVVLDKSNAQKTVELRPAGENRLTGKIDFPVDTKLRATVTLKSANAEVGRARFTVDQTR